ncbi:MAG: sporulation transcription factor Spo0A [Clostridia bacterium]
METNQFGSKTLFVCEPNTILRAEMTHHLAKNSNLNVVGESGDGAECLAFLEKNQVDVLVFDLMLPSIDGLALIDAIKNSGKVAKRPYMVVVSSLSQDGFVSKALSEGVDYFMVKPISVPVLCERVNDIITRQSKDERMLTGLALKSGVFALPRANRQLEEKISNIFITVGIPAHIKGYQFLREAIKLAIDSPEIINSITKRLYPSIAEHFGTSASKVERAIRHAIEVAWNRGKIENINTLFNLKVYSSNEKPTNGEFIALVADKMLIEGA